MSRIADYTRSPTDLDAVRSLKPHEFDQIRQLAYRTFGLDLRTGKEELVSARLRKLVVQCGFRTFQDYYSHVVADASGHSLACMIDALATNHTSFLRESDHFEFLRRQVLPELGNRDPIELWCAACSTGEEVWTLACVLNDALPTRRFQITASDISNKALQVARQGIYSYDRCQGLPTDWRARYFSQEAGPNGGLKISTRIRAQASFRRLNLVEAFSWSRLFPLIFCRNVMIYFDRITQEQVVRRLTACLEPGGYLFVGHAESLTQVSHSLEYVRPAIYRKTPGKRDKWNKSS